MSTLALPLFNPLRFVKRLKEAGVPEGQAEAQAEALHEALAAQAQAVSDLDNQVHTLAFDTKRDAEQMATKAEMTGVCAEMAEMRAEMAEMRAEITGIRAVMATKTDLTEVRGEIALVRSEISLARRDTIIWLGGALIAGFAVVISLLLKSMG